MALANLRYINVLNNNNNNNNNPDFVNNPPTTPVIIGTLPAKYAEQSLCNGTMSVRLFQSSAAAACGGFAAVGPAGRRYRWIAPEQNRAAARHAAANAGSGTFTADVGGWTQIYLYCCMMISCHDFYLSCRCRVPKPGHLDIRSAYRLVCHNYRVGQKSKLLMLSKYVNKTEKIGGTWTNTSQLFYV